MKVGLIISKKMHGYEQILRHKLRSGHTLCFSTDASLLKYPIISGDLSFVAWDSSVSTSSIISLFHKISDLYANIPFFLIEDNEVNDEQKMSIERLIQYKISDNFNLNSDMNRFIEVIRALPAVDAKERKIIRKIYHTVIGESQNIEDLRLFTSRVAKNQEPVLLYGDVGSGKTMTAGTIHEVLYEKNNGKSGKFVAVDIEYIPEDLMDAVLFGRKAETCDGTYTSESLIQRANNGTLFLKNIDRASLLLQTKLWHFLDKKKALEERQERDVDFKLICSSTNSLSHLVSKKKFREDLYYKLNAQEFKIESLLNRKEDIEILATHYCESHNCKLHHSSISKLLLHDWKGNVRELFSILNKALIFSRRIGVVYPENIRFFD